MQNALVQAPGSLALSHLENVSTGTGKDYGWWNYSSERRVFAGSAGCSGMDKIYAFKGAMSYEICYVCETWGETDHDDGCEWDGARYYCSRCVKAQIAAEDPPGDEWEERRIRESEK
jgi:hypothetical protein